MTAYNLLNGANIPCNTLAAYQIAEIRARMWWKSTSPKAGTVSFSPFTLAWSRFF